jgi:type III restriction enzyme
LPEFRFDETAHSFLIDLDGSQLKYEILNNSQQMDLTHISTQWTVSDFVRWLDKELRQVDVKQEALIEFLRRVVESLISGKFDLATLARAKFILVKVLNEKIKSYRTQAYKKGYQETLFSPSSRVETSYEYAFTYDPAIYPAHWAYKGGRTNFTKHFYPIIGEMDSKGEEYECAIAIERLPQVKYWVRNLSNQPRASFWLPTSTDNFYPDFVALLNDGRLLVVEYKGSHLTTTDDSKEKKALGELWELKSNKQGLFLMAEKVDSKGHNVFQQLEYKITT